MLFYFSVCYKRLKCVLNVKFYAGNELFPISHFLNNRLQSYSHKLLRFFCLLSRSNNNEKISDLMLIYQLYEFQRAFIELTSSTKKLRACVNKVLWHSTNIYLRFLYMLYKLSTLILLASTTSFSVNMCFVCARKVSDVDICSAFLFSTLCCCTPSVDLLLFKNCDDQIILNYIRQV